MRCGGIIGKKGDASFAGFVDQHRGHVDPNAKGAPLTPNKVGDLWVSHCPGCGDYWSTAEEMRTPWQGEVFGRIG